MAEEQSVNTAEEIKKGIEQLASVRALISDAKNEQKVLKDSIAELSSSLQNARDEHARLTSEVKVLAEQKIQSEKDLANLRAEKDLVNSRYQKDAEARQRELSERERALNDKANTLELQQIELQKREAKHADGMRRLDERAKSLDGKDRQNSEHAEDVERRRVEVETERRAMIDKESAIRRAEADAEAAKDAAVRAKDALALREVEINGMMQEAARVRAEADSSVRAAKEAEAVTARVNALRYETEAILAKNAGMSQADFRDFLTAALAPKAIPEQPEADSGVNGLSMTPAEAPAADEIAEGDELVGSVGAEFAEPAKEKKAAKPSKKGGKK